MAEKRKRLRPSDGVVFQCRGCKFMWYARKWETRESDGKTTQSECIDFHFRDFNGILWGFQDFTSRREERLRRIQGAGDFALWWIWGRQKLYLGKANTWQTAYYLTYTRRDKEAEQEAAARRVKRSLSKRIKEKQSNGKSC